MTRGNLKFVANVFAEIESGGCKGVRGEGGVNELAEGEGGISCV